MNLPVIKFPNMLLPAVFVFMSEKFDIQLLGDLYIVIFWTPVLTGVKRFFSQDMQVRVPASKQY